MGRSALWGLLIGTALMTLVFMLTLATPSSAGDVSVGRLVAGFIASALFGAVIGGVPGTLVGALVGAARRRPQPVAPPPPQFSLPPPPPQPNDRWAAMVGRCELSVRRVGAAAATVPESAARQWLERIAAQFGGQLSDVRRIADLGRALGADQNHPVTQRLAAAVRDFTAFEDEVGRVALQMLDKASLDAARVHLELLEQQLPHLGDR